jgi:hypothetical protein
MRISFVSLLNVRRFRTPKPEKLGKTITLAELRSATRWVPIHGMM